MSAVLEVSEQNFKNEVLESDKPVLVDFWAPWCFPCKMLGPVIDSISQKFAPGLKVVKLNTQDHPKLTSDYNVQGIPCLLLFKNGQEVERLVGFMPENALEEKLKTLV